MALFKKDPLQIIPFQSYGTSNRFYIRGRALEDENIDLQKRGFFNLIKNTWRRFETDEIPDAKLQIQLPDDTFIHVKTDRKGYFKIKETIPNLNKLTNEEGWLAYKLRFEDSFSGRIIQNDNTFQGEILIPSENSSFGVISDIDDTILHTGVVSKFKWRLIFNTLFKNAESRSPLEGAAQFYHLLHRGASGNEANPMFYVSHSPWNLYRYLELFLRKNNFPKGPILLRSMNEMMGKSEKPQKQLEIIHILETYPNKQFVLIGDAGEHDADIYIEIAETFPKRIKAIFLRGVTHEAKMLRIKSLVDGYKNTPAYLVENAEDAIKAALHEGLVKAALEA